MAADGANINGRHPERVRKGFYMKYSRYDGQSKVIPIIAIMVLIIAIVFFVLSTLGMFDEPLWKTVAEYPIANQHITLKGWNG